MKHFFIKTFFILSVFCSFSYAQAEKNFLGLGVSGHLNGGGFYGEYQYKVHKNFSVGANLGMSFTQKDLLNRAIASDGDSVYYKNEKYESKKIAATNTPLATLFLNARFAFHYGDLVGLGKNFDVYSGFAAGPSFYLTNHIDLVNAKNYLEKSVYEEKSRPGGLTKNSKIVGLKTIDFHLAFFSGFRYFFTKCKVGIQTELALGYNMNALKMGAVWKL